MTEISLFGAEAFTQGMSGFADARPGIREPLPRIYVRFVPEGSRVWYLALLDTGGHYCILSPDVADSIRTELGEPLGRTELVTARGRIQGELYEHTIDLIAEHGEDVSFNAIVMISPDWFGPNVLGYTGVLDRVRFAVDPRTNRFYFGPLS